MVTGCPCVVASDPWSKASLRICVGNDHIAMAIVRRLGLWSFALWFFILSGCCKPANHSIRLRSKNTKPRSNGSLNHGEPLRLDANCPVETH
jgi:hypothetical protein